RKWEKRDDVQDRSHRPHHMAPRLTEVQEMVLLEIRNMLLLPLDDLLVIARKFIKAGITRSSLTSPGCPTKPATATSSSPSTAPPAGCSSRSTPIRPREMPSIS
ncbi:MAG: hypothetical protein LBO00_05470, partial [Zoogloeaceae bacterium]|nr:hypothetical protein [Zoogloeaceae bacterium]